MNEARLSTHKYVDTQALYDRALTEEELALEKERMLRIYKQKTGVDLYK